MTRPWKWVLGVLTAAAATAAVYYFVVGPFDMRNPVGPKVDVGGTVERKAVPVPKVPFTDVTAPAGIRFTHFNGAVGQKLLPETMGGGVAVIDFDGDSKPDLFFTNGCPWPGHAGPTNAPCLALYRNKGDGTFENVTEAVGLNVSMYAIGCSVGDYDNDGFPDIFVTGVGGDRLFHNEGGKRFVDLTANAKVGGTGGWPKDLSAEAFLRHAPPIPFGSSATFLDYDGDGTLDLFVCRYCTWSPAIDLSINATLTGVGRTYQQPTSLEGSYCILYRNNGNGTFEDASVATGIQVAEPEGTDANAKLRPVGKSLGVILCDPDGDGWPDLIVANDTVRNFLFHNVPDGKGGRKFEEIGVSAGVAYALGATRGAMGIDVGEYRPGKQAVVIGNFANEPNSFLSLIHPGRLLFSDQAAATGLEGPSRGPLKFGAFFFDYDLDGRLDLLTCNGHIDPDIHRVQSNQSYQQPAQLFWNTGDEVRTFELVTTAASGPDLFQPLVGRGCAFLDFDGDGDLDVVLTANNGPARLLRNDQTLGHHWIRLMLEGDGTTNNTSAIGAEVVVEAGGKTMVRTVTGAKGYLSQSELTVTVGLGPATTVDRVTVRWPGRAGQKQTWTGLAADGTYVLKQNRPETLRR